MARESISRSPRVRSLWQILAAAASVASRETGRFSRAFSIPVSSFFSSNGPRRRSPLTTVGSNNAAASNVVNRSVHPRHSRRLRICRPSPARRESITLVSVWPQNGQCIGTTHRSLAIDRESMADCHYLGAGTLQRSFIAQMIQHIGDPVRQLLCLGFLEAARGDGRRADAPAAADG